MDCCSSTSYMDYRHHSMNSNFCYPYAPSMLRSASPYPLAGPVGVPGRYGPDTGGGGYHRSSALGYASSMGYPHEGYDKYYGGYHHHTGASGHGSIGGGYGTSGYYGSYSSSAYREYGGYGHYYGHHQSQSPYSRGYGAGTTGAGSAAYLYPGRHYPGSGGLAPQHPGFARADSYLYHHPQQRGEQPQYSSFASYGSIPTPFRSSLGSGGGATTSDPPSAKSPYSTSSPGFPATGSNHLERPVAAASAQPSAPPSGVNGSSGALDSAARSPSSTASLFPNGYSPSSGYSPLSASYRGPTAADDSPQLPLQPEPDEGDAPQQPHAAAAAAAVRGATEFSPDGGSPKEARGTRKPKERKLQQQQRGMMYGGQPNGGRSSSSAGSRASSPTTAAAAASASARMKSLDALTNLCWPDGEQFSSKMRKYSNASGLKSKDGATSRKQDVNDLELSAAASPSRTTGTGRRAKKQTKQQKELKSSDGKEKQTSSAVTSVPPVENKNVTPLPGFQQAFGSTEIGKFSEVFFNSSPTPNESSPSQHHHAMHHPQAQQQQLQHQQRIQQQQQQQQQHHHHGTVQQLVMDSLNAYESDVDTLSPQSWDPPPAAAAPAPTDSYEGCTGYNLQIGTSFHPSYFESSSYSDHAVDSPLGSYFSEMTCNEFVN
ncbi:AF4/FMR2 family member lilli [Anopheles bellator]|uniref:AF4/FMR2 family member lilli n=1 Tax=Anopheles bellator TaxID=139047 RepID=UPI00264A13F3|nr:AF4/FMR2 family member lilli [Anopheles bellator]